MALERVVVVLGTGTGVGKTWVGACLLRTLRRRGVEVGARKPAQSFDPGSRPTDAEVLAEAAGESPLEVCPPHRWYEVAMAPPMAAELLAKPTFTISDLVAETRWPAAVRVGIVETAGGVRSPQAFDGDATDLVAAFEQVAPLVVPVLVADAGLGTLNAVRLCLDAVGPVPVVLNRFDAGDELHRRNLSWLRSAGGAGGWARGAGGSAGGAGGWARGEGGSAGGSSPTVTVSVDELASLVVDRT